MQLERTRNPVRGLRELLALVRKDRWLAVVTGLMVLSGVVIRAQSLSYPKQMTFDELIWNTQTSQIVSLKGSIITSKK